MADKQNDDNRADRFGYPENGPGPLIFDENGKRIHGSLVDHLRAKKTAREAAEHDKSRRED